MSEASLKKKIKYHIFIHMYIYIESGKMVLMNLFAEREWRCRHEEWTFWHSSGERAWDRLTEYIFSFEILSVVWFRLRYVFVLWSYVDTEYNIWKAIVSTACADLGFILFGGLCSSSNLNIMCSNVLEDFFITTLSHMLLDHRRLFC